MNGEWPLALQRNNEANNRPLHEMTTDQQKTIDGLSLFYGGWAKVMDVSGDYPARCRPVVRCHTAGDQPNWIVFEDGSAVGAAPFDDIMHATAEQIHAVVYGDERQWDGPSSQLGDLMTQSRVAAD